MTETVQIVEIKQPQCANTFGVAPCTATGDGSTKCYNTRASCLDKPNYALDATPLSLYFGSSTAAERSIPGVPRVFPGLLSVSTIPTRINPASPSPDAGGLGRRAQCVVSFEDFIDADFIVDPYLSERPWEPRKRGTFWTKWLARNPYFNNIEVTVYEGVAGEKLSAMVKRCYFVESIDFPDTNGVVTLYAVDPLKRLEERQLKVPTASPGVLYVDIDDTQTSIEATGATTADYSASGTIRVNDEIMTYSSRSSSANGVTFTISARGTDRSTAASHEAGDSVQECKRYTTQVLEDVLEDLLSDAAEGNIPVALLDTTGWADELGVFRSFTTVTTLITEPTSVFQLVGELAQAGVFAIWWDERSQLVKVKAITGARDELTQITDLANIKEGFSIKLEPRERLSQVWIYYQPKSWTGNMGERDNFRSWYVEIDVDAESDAEHGSASIKEIYSRWLSSESPVVTATNLILTRYVDLPRNISFEVSRKDAADIEVGEMYALDVYSDVDIHGARRNTQWLITSYHPIDGGRSVRYTAVDATLYGTISYFMDNAALDYDPDTAPAKNAYFGDADGLLSDGTTGAVFS